MLHLRKRLGCIVQTQQSAYVSAVWLIVITTSERVHGAFEDS